MAVLVEECFKAWLKEVVTVAVINDGVISLAHDAFMAGIELGEEVQSSTPKLSTEPEDSFWETINKETGKDLLDIVYGLVNDLLTPNEALNAIAERCNLVYKKAINKIL